MFGRAKIGAAQARRTSNCRCLQVLALGSFHSFLLGPDVPTLLFYDIATDPKQPKYRAGVYPEYGALADDWVRLGNGGFLVSLMGDKDGEFAIAPPVAHPRRTFPTCTCSAWASLSGKTATLRGAWPCAQAARPGAWPR